MRRTLSRAFILLALAAPTSAGLAQPAETSDWSDRKCALYTEAWLQATSGDVLEAIGPDFLDAHDAFLVSGCREEGRVCPTTEAESALADTLTLMAVAEGMTGSFLPFACEP